MGLAGFDVIATLPDGRIIVADMFGDEIEVRRQDVPAFRQAVADMQEV